jgi:hypothetical protein
MKLDPRSLLLALAIALLLAVLALFGGPHGALGGWTWFLNLPGLALVYLIPGNSYFAARVVAAFLVQVMVWYFLVRALRR